MSRSLSRTQFSVAEEKSYDTNNILAWIVCMTGGLFFFFEFIQMNVLNSLSDVIMQTFHIHAEGLGFLSSTYFYADAFMLIPAGIILDRYSTRVTIIVTFLFCILGTLGFALAESIRVAELARVVTGAGNAFCFLACMRLASRWFPPHHMALISGSIVTLAMLGGAMAQAPMTMLMDVFSWRHAMLLNAGLGIFLLLLIVIVVRDFPQGQQKQHARELATLQKIGMRQSLISAVNNWQNWLGGIYTCLMNSPLVLLGALWGGLFLQGVYQLTPDQASVVSSMIFIGTIFGSPILGFISDKVYRRRAPMAVCAVLSFVVGIAIIFGTSYSYYQLMLLFFLLGFVTSAQTLSYPLIMESNAKAISSTALSLASMLIMLGCAIFQDFSGWLLNLHWNGQVIDDKPIYSVSDYHFAMVVIPISFLVALLAALLTRETNCRQHEEI